MENNLSLLQDSLNWDIEFNNLWFSYIKKIPIDYFDWNLISANDNLSINIIEENPDLPWNFVYLSKNKNINFDFIYSNLDKDWDWNMLSKHKNINTSIIHLHPELNWNYQYISENPNLTWQFILDNIDKNWNWDSLSRNIHPNIIFENLDYPWNYFSICLNINLNEKILEKVIKKNIDINSFEECKNFISKFNWNILSYHQNISIKYMLDTRQLLENYNQEWNWEGLFDKIEKSNLENLLENNIELIKKFSKNKNLDEKILKKYPNFDWDWDEISKNINISWKFIEEMIKEKNISFNFIYLSCNPIINCDIINKNINLDWKWYWVSTNSNLNWEFVYKNLDKNWDWSNLSRNQMDLWRHEFIKRKKIKYKKLYINNLNLPSDIKNIISKYL